MSVDPIIKACIEEAIAEENQDDELSRKIIAWYDSLLNGNEDLSDDERVISRLALIFDEIKCEGIG